MANFYLALVTTPDWDSAITKGFLPAGACLHTNEVEAVKAFGQINLKGYFSNSNQFSAWALNPKPETSNP